MAATDCCRQHVAVAVAAAAAAAAVAAKVNALVGDVTSAIQFQFFLISRFSPDCNYRGPECIANDEQNTKSRRNMKSKTNCTKSKQSPGKEGHHHHHHHRVERTLLHSTVSTNCGPLWERQCAGSTGVEVERSE